MAGGTETGEAVSSGSCTWTELTAIGSQVAEGPVSHQDTAHEPAQDTSLILLGVQ